MEHRLNEELLSRRASEYRILNDEDMEDFEESPEEEVEEIEEEFLNQASAAQTIGELEKEIATLKGLEALANHVRLSGKDENGSNCPFYCKIMLQ